MALFGWPAAKCDFSCARHSVVCQSQQFGLCTVFYMVSHHWCVIHPVRRVYTKLHVISDDSIWNQTKRNLCTSPERGYFGECTSASDFCIGLLHRTFALDFCDGNDSKPLNLVIQNESQRGLKPRLVYGFSSRLKNRLKSRRFWRALRTFQNVLRVDLKTQI